MVDLDTRVRPESPSPTTAPATRRRPRRQLLPYLLLIPAVVLELLIHIVPMLVGIFISFLHLTQFYIANWRQAPAAGLSNYRYALDFNQAAGKELLHSFLITLVFTVVVLAVSWALGMAAAVFLQRPFPGRAIIRTIFLIPYALPVFASVITWNFMLQRDNGVVNHVLVDQLHLVGGDRPFWLIGPNSFYSLVIVEVWRTWPFAFLMLTAGMQSISQDLYEAAGLDGAGVWAQFRGITLPMLRPVNRVLLLVLFLWTFNDFTTPYTLFGRGAPRQADLISMHIYQNSFVTWNFGTGSAMSVLLLLFLLVITGGYLRIANRGAQDA
ncbi:MAG: multiple sugar transport system permease protein [Pseudonocardiales bacterium]|jgi:multiple sugar transport system permease protein|nr:sugar transporter permease [Jatrophihabitans sp.]MDT4904411.1 multiple sugar transport system permease protein [Pseudonocardiales bacterium]